METHVSVTVVVDTTYFTDHSLAYVPHQYRTSTLLPIFIYLVRYIDDSFRLMHDQPLGGVTSRLKHSCLHSINCAFFNLKSLVFYFDYFRAMKL